MRSGRCGLRHRGPVVDGLSQAALAAGRLGYLFDLSHRGPVDRADPRVHAEGHGPAPGAGARPGAGDRRHAVRQHPEFLGRRGPDGLGPQQRLPGRVPRRWRAGGGRDVRAAGGERGAVRAGRDPRGPRRGLAHALHHLSGPDAPVVLRRFPRAQRRVGVQPLRRPVGRRELPAHARPGGARLRLHHGPLLQLQPVPVGLHGEAGAGQRRPAAVPHLPGRGVDIELRGVRHQAPLWLLWAPQSDPCRHLLSAVVELAQPADAGPGVGGVGQDGGQFHPHSAPVGRHGQRADRLGLRQ